MKTAWLVAATVVALTLQTSLSRFVTRGNLTLDLVLVVVVYAALTSGPVTGLLMGTVAGLVQDALSTGIIGTGGLAKTIVGFLAGVVGTHFIVAQLPSRFVVFFAATLLHAAIFIGVYQILGLGDSGSPYAATLEQAIGNAVVGVVIFQLVERMPAAVERRRLTRTRSRR